MNTKSKIMTTTYTLPCATVKAKTMATIICIISAVLLPQIVHTIGVATGTGSSLGELLLPMYLPIVTLGLLAGPYMGLIAGVCAPLISFALTGMPAAGMLPFIMIELVVLGVSSGILSTKKIPMYGKLVISQLVARVVRIMAMAFACYVLGSTFVKAPMLMACLTTGLLGMVVQWIVAPLVVKLVGKDE